MDMTPMMTIPSVALRWSETLASVCPARIQLRIRKPCMVNTFSALGSIAP